MKILKSLIKPFTGLAGAVESSVNRKIALTVLRKCAMVIAVYLAHEGYIEANHVEEFVGYFVGLVSLFSGVQNVLNHG